MRRTVALDYIPEIPEEIDPTTLTANRLFDYVPECRDNSPLAGLLWAEVYNCFRRAKLTPLEASIMDIWMHGFSDRQAADALNRCLETNHYTRHNVSSIRQGAEKKLIYLPHKGVVTVLIETFGLRACRQNLSTRKLKAFNID